ncbi:MAG: Multidrug export protein EmrA [Firmicutes bacterium ADurb.Bin193]|nr:MAG: Multidrug export protein EmrA [Firmicutes bacterium ADurb.Bin193]
MFKHKKIIIAIAAAAIVIIVTVASSINGAVKNTAKIKSNLAEVVSGSIVDKVKGTGVVIAGVTYDITSLQAGMVTSSGFEEGDTVRKGDVLCTIDSREIENQIRSARINLDRCEENYRQSLAAYDDLTTVSGYSGKIQRLYVSKGDFVAAGTKIADVVDNSYLILKIPFNTTDVGRIKKGDTASITLASDSLTMQGVVSRIYDYSESLSGYRMVTYIEITVNNPGAVTKGEKAYAEVNGIGCNSAGEFINSVEKTIVSGGSGQITELNIREGDYINEGKTVLILKNDQVTNAKKSSEIALRDARNNLENLIAGLEDYKIKSPADGTVVSKNIKKGDNVTPQTVLMTVSDLDNLYVDVEVDEIFIAKVVKGQTAEITAEALPDRVFTGEVVRIDNVGVAKNGVTYYPVRVKIEQSPELKVGMNLSVGIVVMTKDSVMLIPKDALTGDSVMLYEDGKLREVKVQTGIRDNDYVEVVSGLKIGDMVSSKRGN